MLKKSYVYFLISLLIFAGCQTTKISQIPYRKEYSKYVNDMAILPDPVNPELGVDIRNDEMFIAKLITGPAIIPQLFLRLAQNTADEEDVISFSEILLDLDIGGDVCEKLNTKFQLCSYFHVVPQESIKKNKVIGGLLEENEKDSKDYEKIGTELDIDTILEVEVIAYGIKDPGIFSDPYAFIKIDVKMTKAAEGTVIWRDVVEAKTAIGMSTVDFLENVYTDDEFLEKKLEEVEDAVTEQCIEKLGFDTNYTYLLEEDYIEKTKHKINIAEKLNELNNLRHEDFISKTDYDKTKLELIEKVKDRNVANPDPLTNLSFTEKTNSGIK
ncbi:MAG: hypothetical protein ACYSTS_11045 [Planctomycetota bacterium]|jgi:hypothetical protein